MNALRATTTRHNAMKSLSRRLLSSVHAIPKPPLPECYLQHNFRTDYLSDPSTYPIIAVMCFSACLIVGMSANIILNDSNDIRVFPKHKQDVLRTWGDEQVYDKLTRKLAMGPIIMNEKGYRTLWQEGLGVDHEEWLKQKQQQHQLTEHE